jgi:hypothetical protein
MSASWIRSLALLPGLAALAACGGEKPAQTAIVTPPPVVVQPPPAAVIAPGTVLTPAPGIVVPPTSGIAGTTSVPSAAPARLGTDQIAALLAGNTATGIASDGRPYVAYFLPDGQVRFRVGTVADSGTWRATPDGRLCSSLVRIDGGAEQCYSLYRVGSSYRFDRPDGNQVGSFQVVAGNPQSL